MNSLGLIGAAVAAAIAGMPAQAQNATPVSEEVEEVLVTARRRSETFKDVPMTVNVFTRETIEAAGIDRPADFIARVPNMTLVETQNAGNAFVVIRGISQARNSEPSVAVLVDGVLETNPAEFNQELFDIEQIEVLKGPQGAVYGRNAIGGAIIIQTKAPGDEFEGRVKLGYGNENSMRAQAGSVGRWARRSATAPRFPTTTPTVFCRAHFSAARPIRSRACRHACAWTSNRARLSRATCVCRTRISTRVASIS